MRLRSSITAGVLTGLAVSQAGAKGNESWTADVPLALALLLLFALAWSAVRAPGTKPARGDSRVKTVARARSRVARVG